jgi:prepilin peptidase CpaA
MAKPLLRNEGRFLFADKAALSPRFKAVPLQCDDKRSRQMLVAAILVIFPFAMAHAAVSDMVSMTIANRVSLLLIGSFLVLAPLTGMPVPQIGMHVLAFAMVLGICFGFFALGVMGGGDAKLMASSGLWFGLNLDLMTYLVVASALGGVLTVLILSFRRSNITVVAGQVDFLRRIADPKEKIPYGIALGTAGLLLYPDTPLMRWAIVQMAGL